MQSDALMQWGMLTGSMIFMVKILLSCVRPQKHPEWRRCCLQSLDGKMQNPW